ncbi:hypothetical protein ACIOEX_21745, partial [Streptomyces sp. NPDC087850]|uniref:hypothetical protein n=1 Tax=Streptomyces sp. NPDC087850 TaxID=3365809 RepID=UPI00380AC12B
KGRGVPPPVHVGEQHHDTRLTAEMVLCIREKYDSGHYSHARLASEYKMSRASIGAIVRHETWRHVEAPQPIKGAA